VWQLRNGCFAAFGFARYRAPISSVCLVGRGDGPSQRDFQRSHVGRFNLLGHDLATINELFASQLSHRSIPDELIRQARTHLA